MAALDLRGNLLKEIVWDQFQGARPLALGPSLVPHFRRPIDWDNHFLKKLSRSWKGSLVQLDSIP